MWVEGNQSSKLWQEKLFGSVVNIFNDISAPFIDSSVLFFSPSVLRHIEKSIFFTLNFFVCLTLFKIIKFHFLNRFCPSVFLYLVSVVPAIWLLELDKVERRHKIREETFSLAAAAADLKELDKLLGVNIKLPELNVDAETWITLIEQFLMLILIIGRWLLPKGDLTRDQLSQLLLVYIGETFFSEFSIYSFPVQHPEHDGGDLLTHLNCFLSISMETSRHSGWHYRIFRLIQREEDSWRANSRVSDTFNLVVELDAIHYCSHSNSSEKATRSDEWSRWRVRANRRSFRAASHNCLIFFLYFSWHISRSITCCSDCCCSIDVWGIVLNIILQDAPFLTFRLLIIIHYQIISYMNVFFTCKFTILRRSQKAGWADYNWWWALSDR